MTAPPPLTPPDSDLRDFQFMPLDVVRFAQSDLVAFAPPEAVVAAILLWGASWHQTPAGSLTNDDRALANLAGYGRAVPAWQAIKAEALRGFVECSDGRLYHPVVAEKVRDAWTGKLKQRHRTYLAAIRQHNGRYPDDQRQGPTFDEWLAQGRQTTVRAAQKAPEQDEFPLAPPAPPQHKASRAPNSDERQENATNDGNGNVTRDKATMSRVTDDPCHARVTHENTSKGQGEGQGQGEGDSYNNNPPTPLGVEPDPFASGSVLDIAQSLARIAGVSLLKPTAISRAVDVVKAWQADGLDIAGVVVPVIRRHIADNPEGNVHSLAYFDPAIRKALAVANAGEGRRKPKPSGPAIVLRHTDQPDDRVKAIRGRLNGKPEHAVDALAMSIDEEQDFPVLILTCRSGFAASRVDRNLFETLAHEILSPEAEVEVRQQ